MNLFGKNLALWIIIALLVVALFNLFQSPSMRGPNNELAYTDFMAQVKAGQVSDVTIQGQNITGHTQDGRAFTVYAPMDPDMISQLRDQGVRIKASPADEGNPLFSIFVSWFPMLLLIAVWIFFMRQMQSGGG
ncbi:MAG: ATP-dependent metallopeptidase FtsH/Yme1/Tma family protein, partial [Minwuiales bacterium]|nr:ATP-dependent metallopeptidase FtsH/Yme1/Tma family protein [Minwuiales bacterium]